MTNINLVRCIAMILIYYINGSLKIGSDGNVRNLLKLLLRKKKKHQRLMLAPLQP